MDKNHRHRLRRPLRLERSSIYSGTITNCGYAYDLNGNMTANGAFTYAWDPENRLAAVWKDGTLVQSNRYDALWRRREKVEYAPDGTAATNRYIYKDWLVLAITDASGTLLETYTHGADLSGEVGGEAGGIGGILASSQAGGTMFCSYDFSGNVVLVASSDQSTFSTHAYTPFGIVFASTGSFTPRYQFSSKESDTAIKFIYFGFRFYSTDLCRWVNRDPTEAISQDILYNFVNNDPVNLYDYLGQSTHGNREKTRVHFVYQSSGRICRQCLSRDCSIACSDKFMEVSAKGKTAQEAQSNATRKALGNWHHVIPAAKILVFLVT